MGVRVRVVHPLLLHSSCLFSGTSLGYIWSSPALGYSKTRGQPQNCEVSEAGLQVTGYTKSLLGSCSRGSKQRVRDRVEGSLSVRGEGALGLKPTHC